MKTAVIGIDVGYLYAKVVALDGAGNSVWTRYVRHGGDYRTIIRKLVEEKRPAAKTPVVLTGNEIRGWVAADGGWIHEARALSVAAGSIRGDARAVLHVGASGVSMVGFSESGGLSSFEANTLCAAGTGSFLDEQAERLGVDYGAPVHRAPNEEIPRIATRCTVFAKSDLIHRQQEGCSREAMWVGLCRGMTETLFQTLLKGRALPGLTLITGGVSQNEFVIEAAQEKFPGLVEVFPEGHLAPASGAARHALESGSPLVVSGLLSILDAAVNGNGARDDARHPSLRLVKSSYPTFEVEEEYEDDDGNEVRVVDLKGTTELVGFLGLDIGSTSTKLALVDESGTVRCDIYRPTAGAPVAASRKLLKALHGLLRRLCVDFTVAGVATTGSGRKLVGMVLGADVIINEITAHARGAAATAGDDLETIFEIGGQDAKYIRLHKGHIRDSNMNFVCSAGTGSFVEEQARKLGFAVQEVGKVTQGVSPPATSDRCTVFMEQDVVRLLSQGSSREEAMGAVLYSVVKNYLNKVVGNRPVNKQRVVFQGATARNRGLVAAFEHILGVEVVVSPFCHVMGSIGAALVALQRCRGASSFVGFEALDEEVSIAQSECELCANYCRITTASLGDGVRTSSWGYLCGRDPAGPAKPVRHDRAFRVLDAMTAREVRETNRSAPEHAPVIGFPNSLSTRALLPFWAGFLRELGLAMKVDGETDQEIRQLGSSLAAADFCFPVKAHLGHVRRVLADPEVDFALIPFFISEERNEHTTNSLVCPYVESSPSVFRAVADDSEVARLLTPVVDFRWSNARQAEDMEKLFKDKFPGVTRSKLKKALAAGHANLNEFTNQTVAKGEEFLAEWKEKGEKAIVFVGRPYNVRDLGLNLAIPRHFAQLGHHVLPHEMLPFRPETLGTEFNNVFWAYGQRILSALRQVGENDSLFPVYLTNFNCGPDSFLLTYAEEILKNKPFLVLELDEHGSEGGYLTRIEAFCDVIGDSGPAVSNRSIRVLRLPNDEFKDRKLWIPPLHPVTSRLFAAAFRSAGFEAECIPVETQSSFQRGRTVTRGSECLPTCSTIGKFLELLEERRLDPEKQAYFMATARGPCRFGQYELLHRMILDKQGYESIPILSPASFNSYQGLGEEIRRLSWTGILIADILYKARCRVAPYEVRAGAADAVLEKWVRRYEDAISRGDKLEPLMAQAIEEFSAIEKRPGRKPLVGIVGEIYVRCNPFTNDNLVRSIEEYGGEAWLAPVSEWLLYVAQNQAWFAGEGLNALAAQGLSVLKNRFMRADEKRWYDLGGELLADRHEPSMADVLKEGMVHIPMNFEGEAIITIGRAILFAKQGAKLVVNAAPFGCMPGTLTTAVMRRLQEELGVPIVGMFYDGTAGLNRSLEPFLDGLRAQADREVEADRGATRRTAASSRQP